MGAETATYQGTTNACDLIFGFQEGPICTPIGRDCVDAEASKTYNCKTACTGIYTDVQWHDETLGKSRDGGKEENRESYHLLVNEYRQFQRNYSRNFRFEATADADNQTFGENYIINFSSETVF